MARRRLCLQDLLKIRLVNSMILLSGYSIQQSYLAMSDHGRIPKVKNRYPIVKAIFDLAI